MSESLKPEQDPLTAIQGAIEKALNGPPRACGVTEPHVVSPKARGWTTCANCFGPVFVCLRESGCGGISHDIRCNKHRYQPLFRDAESGDPR